MSKIIYKFSIPVSGMHCRSCEMLIEEKLSEIPEVIKSRVDYKKGVAEIYCGEQKPNQREVYEAIRSAGYDIGSNAEASFINKNISDYKDLGIAFLFLVGLYFALKSLGLTSLSLGSFSDNPSNIFVALLVGLIAGLSTCMALVGGLVLGISARHAEKHPEATAAQKFRPHLYFNLGRIGGFSLMGGMLGALGSFLQVSTLTLGIFTILVGLVMLLMGLQLVEIFPALNRIKITIPKFISRALGIKSHQAEYSHGGSMTIGALTFFLPCGFTQAMQLYAVSAGSFAKGAIVMGLFALGTAPGLLGVGGITSAVKGIFAKRFFKFAGLLVIFFALFNIVNGYNLTGWQTNGSSASVSIKGDPVDDPSVVTENGVQIVKMKQLANGYSPNKFTIKKGVPVKWVIDSVDPFSCASAVTVPKLNIIKHLVKGENTIEFTPDEAGVLKFSCSMGMYTGVFNVVDNNGSGASSAELNAAAKPSDSSCGGSGGSCGCGHGG